MITKISNPYIDIPKTFRIFVVLNYIVVRQHR